MACDTPAAPIAPLGTGKDAALVGAEPSAPRIGWVGLLIIGVVAVAARVTIAEQLGHTVLYQTPQLDGFEFLQRARRIGAGDFSVPDYPTHGPIYPFFLAGVLALVGGSLRSVRWIQALVGAATCTATAALAARLWRDRRAGIVSGILLALYGPLAFVDIELWEEGLFLLFLMIALWLLERPERGVVRAGGAGLALGAASAIRPTALLLLPLWALAQLAGGDRRRRGRAAVALLLGTLLVVAPIVAAVSHAAGTFLLVRGFGAVNVWIGNDPAGGGVQNARLGGAWEWIQNAPLREGLTDPGALESYFLRRSWQRLRQDPWSFLRVQASKLFWLVQAEEPRDNHSFYFFREQSGLLSLLPGFGVLFGFAAVGGVEMRRRRIAAWHLAGLLVSTAATVAIALVGLRYRLPLVPPLAAIAGGGAIALWNAARQRQARRLAALAAIALGAAAVSHLRHHPPTHDFAEEWALSGRSLETAGRLDEAESAYRRSMDLDPASAMGWDGIGRVRMRQGRMVEAETALRESLARHPEYDRSHYHFGQLLLQRGETKAGIAQLEAALAISPQYTPALETLAEQFLASGEPEKAEPLYQRLVRALPRDPAGWEGLARVAGARDRPADGLAAARRATELAPGRPSAWQLLGYLAVQVPDLATAQQALAHLEALGADANSRLFLASAIEHVGGNWAAADRILRRLVASQPDFAAARALMLRNAERMGRRAEAEEFLHRLTPVP